MKKNIYEGRRFMFQHPATTPSLSITASGEGGNAALQYIDALQQPSFLRDGVRLASSRGFGNFGRIRPCGMLANSAAIEYQQSIIPSMKFPFHVRSDDLSLTSRSAR